MQSRIVNCFFVWEGGGKKFSFRVNFENAMFYHLAIIATIELVGTSEIAKSTFFKVPFNIAVRFQLKFHTNGCRAILD